MAAENMVPPERSDAAIQRAPGARTSGARRAAVVAVLLLLVAFSGLLGFNLYSEYRRGLENARAQSAQLATALEMYTRLCFGRLNQDLHAIARDLRSHVTDGQAPATTFSEALRRHSSTAADIGAVAWLRPRGGDSGIDVLGDLPVALGDPGASDVYAVHRDEDRGLVVGSPRSDPASGRWFILVSSRVHDDKGGFGGALVAAVSESELRDFLKSLHMGEQGGVALLRNDGLILARYPFSPEQLGTSVAKGAVFSSHLPQNPVGTVRIRTLVDGVERFASYRMLSDLPLVVFVGVAISDALSDFFEQLRIAVAAWALTVVAALGTLFVFLRGDALRSAAEAGRAEALEHSEQAARRLRATQDSLTEAVVTFDAEGRIESANAAAERLFGYSSDELKARSFRQFVLSAEPSGADWFAAAAGSAGEAPHEVFGTRRDGRSFPAELRLSRFRLDDHELYVASMSDVSARREALRQAQVSDSRFRAIFDSASHAITLLRPDGVILEVNVPLLTRAGITRDVVVGKPAWEAPWWRRSPEGAAWLRDAIRRANSGEQISRRIVGLDRTARPAQVDYSLKPIRNSDGEITYLLVEAREIVDQSPPGEPLHHSP